MPKQKKYEHYTEVLNLVLLFTVVQSDIMCHVINKCHIPRIMHNKYVFII